MRPELTEPFRKIRKTLTLIETDMDDVEAPEPQMVEHNLQKLEGLINELRALNTDSTADNGAASS